MDRRNRVGTTILLMENMPELHERVTTSWWRRQARFARGPAQRFMEWMIENWEILCTSLGLARS